MRGALLAGGATPDVKREHIKTGGGITCLDGAITVVEYWVSPTRPGAVDVVGRCKHARWPAALQHQSPEAPKNISSKRPDNISSEFPQSSLCPRLAPAGFRYCSSPGVFWVNSDPPPPDLTLDQRCCGGYSLPFRVIWYSVLMQCQTFHSFSGAFITCCIFLKLGSLMFMSADRFT